MIVWLLATALVAAEPADEEIVVWGGHAVRQARADVVRQMEALGWSARDRREKIVFRAPRAWMGSAVLRYDGQLDFRRPFPLIPTGSSPAALFAVELDDGADIGRVREDRVGAEIDTTLLPAKRKVEAVQQRVRRVVQPAVDSYRTTLQETAFREYLHYDLPQALDAVWADGTPLTQGPPLDSPAARREAVLAFWSSRADTREGVLVSQAVERWLRRVVQESEAPLTDAEIAAAEARRADGRRLDLTAGFGPVAP